MELNCLFYPETYINRPAAETNFHFEFKPPFNIILDTPLVAKGDYWVPTSNQEWPLLWWRKRECPLHEQCGKDPVSLPDSPSKLRFGGAAFVLQ